ncbi:g2245 [Coccomyxa elongata]
MKSFMPLVEVGSNVVIGDPSDLVDGRNYRSWLSNKEYFVQGYGAYPEDDCKQSVTRRVVEDLAGTGVEAKIEWDVPTYIMGGDNLKEEITKVDRMVRASDMLQLWIIAHNVVLNFQFGIRQHMRLQSLKKCIKSGTAMNHLDTLNGTICRGMDLRLVLAGDIIAPKDKWKLEGWAAKKGVPLYTRSGACCWVPSGGASITDAKPV